MKKRAQKPVNKRACIFWGLFAGALVVFAVFFSVLFTQLYRNAKGNIITLRQSDVRSTVIELNVYLDTAINAITFSKENMEILHEKGASSQEVWDSMILITQTFLSYIEDNIAGVYGYIYGEYVDGNGWVPSEDFDPKSRPWYIAAEENPGKIVYVPPYVDAESGQVCVTLSQTLEGDSESVVAFDLALTSLQKMVKESARHKEVLAARIIDTADKVIIASNDDNEILRDFGLEQDYPELWELAEQEEAQFLELKKDGRRYLIFSEPLTMNWRFVQVYDEQMLFQELINLYLFSGIGCLVAILIVLAGFLLWKVNYERADRLFHESRTDALTGIQNRGGGETDIEKLLRDKMPGLFLMFDVDKFKRINDNYGHDMGDKVLIALAGAMRDTVRRGDPAMRLGGDEFVTYLTGIIRKDQAQAIINRLFTNVEKIRIEGLENEKLSVSVGAVFYDGEDLIHFMDLYKKADERIYQSKKHEGNYVTF